MGPVGAHFVRFLLENPVVRKENPVVRSNGMGPDFVRFLLENPVVRSNGMGPDFVRFF